MSDEWRKCSSCRASIDHGRRYYVCSVSTCNRNRLALYFCSVPCWEAHLPVARHREAWAEDKTAPTRAQAESEERAAAEPARRKMVPSPPGPPSARGGPPRDILVVVSKLKAYVKAASEMNTSDSVMSTLSDQIRRLCDLAAQRAAEDGRKTIMDRDFLPSDIRPST